MMKHYLLASTVLAGILAVSLPASAVTIGGAALKSQPAVSDSTSDSTLLVQIKGARGSKGGHAKGNDDDDDQGDDNDDQGEDDDNQGEDEQ